MEDRVIDDSIKSPHSLSICSGSNGHGSNGSDVSINSSCSCITNNNHYHNFKSSSSCTHTYTNTTNTNHSAISTISNITLKSNSPAIMIPNNRRNSISINNCDIINNNLTVLQLQLTNSETIDTKDVYVMAKHTPKTLQHLSNNKSMQLNKLSIPKWNNNEIEESADEYGYDSEAHTITDEDIIIKRVLHKFNQQNQKVVRRNISFVDSFQFFQSNINNNHKRNKSSIDFKIKDTTDNDIIEKKSKSKNKPNKNNNNNIHSNNVKRKRKNRNALSRSHIRTITPFDPITDHIFSDSDCDTPKINDMPPKNDIKLQNTPYSDSNILILNSNNNNNNNKYTHTKSVSTIPNMEEIKQIEWNELKALNEETDSDEENLETIQNIAYTKNKNNKNNKTKNNESKRHRRLISAPIKLKNTKSKTDLHIYQTWNYFEDMSDSLKSDYESENKSNGSENSSDESNKDKDKEMDKFDTERVFSTFTKELGITSENPKYLFESLSEICTSLRNKFMEKSNGNNTNKIKYEIPFNSPILQYERVISFLKLLGFNKNNKNNGYIIHKININNVNSALISCQQQLIELSKKSTTYDIIKNKNEEKQLSETINTNTNNNIDSDSCQLYELIWSTTHHNNNDNKAKDIILLCYILITTPIKFIKLLEARFFNDDYGRASTSSNTSNSHSNSSSNSLSSLSLPSSIIFDYERIQSSYGVQKKVINIINTWIEKYWIEDWNNNYKLLSYIQKFIKKIRNAYKTDDDFDEFEQNKGLELINNLNKLISKQKHNKHNKNNISHSQSINSFDNIFNRPRSISSNTEIINRNRNNRNNNNNNNKRRTSLHKQKQKQKQNHKRKFSLLSAPKLYKRNSYDSGSISNNNIIPFDLLKISNEEICNQLTLYLFNKYLSINERECLYQYSPIHKNKENICPNIKIYKNTFNNIVKWVQSTILLQSNVSKRARIIKKWIKITDLLFNIRCFQGFVAVQCALSSNAIYILKHAWNQNNILKRKHHTKFKEIKVIMSASHNFENLRRLQREAHPPLIPYFGLFCKDLIYIQEGISKRNQNGMINWNKLWRISELIKEHFHKKTYKKIIKNNIQMQNWLKIQLKQSGTLKTEHIDKIARDVAQKDKNKKIRHKKSFTLMQ